MTCYAEAMGIPWDYTKATAIAAWNRRTDLTPPAADYVAGLDRVQHVKRGSTYEVLGRGKIQTDTPLIDYAEVAIYRSEDDGMIWVRPVGEFDDGRFAALAARPASPDTRVVPTEMLTRFADAFMPFADGELELLAEIRAIIGGQDRG